VTILDEILDDAVAGAEKAIPGAVAPWIDRAITALSAQIPSLPETMQPFAHKSLDSIVAHKDVFSALPQKVFVAVATHLTLGDGPKAQAIYLATNASFDERQAILDSDSDAVRQEVADRSQAWQKVKSVSEGLLLAFGKLLIPVVLAL